MSDFLKKDGSRIELEFDVPLMDLIGGEEAHFTVKSEEYNYVPNGTIEVVKKEIGSVTKISDCVLQLDMVPTKRFNSCVGKIYVSYDGEGQIYGEDGPLLAFETEFIPEDLEWKGHVKPDGEFDNCVTVKEMTSTAVLIKITYHNIKSDDEHIAVSDIMHEAKLTRVSDI